MSSPVPRSVCKGIWWIFGFDKERAQCIRPSVPSLVSKRAWNKIKKQAHIQSLCKSRVLPPSFSHKKEPTDAEGYVWRSRSQIRVEDKKKREKNEKKTYSYMRLVEGFQPFGANRRRFKYEYKKEIPEKSWSKWKCYMNETWEKYFLKSKGK